MNFEYTKIPEEKAYDLRKRFIDTFVDTSKELYIKYIKDLQAKDTVNAEGFVVSFLWSCLKKNVAYKVDFYDAMRFLHKRKNENVFVMWDIRPYKVIYPEEWWEKSIYTPPCELILKSDEVISITPKELCEVLIHDHHIETHRLGDIVEYFLREDVYVFDETFTWYIALTHNEVDTHNEKRLCFSNVHPDNNDKTKPMMVKG